MISRRLMLIAAAASPASAALAASGAKPLPQVVTGELHYDGGRIWTPVSIGGRGPYRFIIDTGAAISGLDESLGQMLGLKSLRKMMITGVKGSREVDVFLATDVIIGKAFSQKEIALLGLGTALRDSNGLLAAGVLTFFDSEIDVEAGKFRLFPQGQTDRTGYSRVPGRWNSTGDGTSKQLHVKVMVAGHPAELLVDTGSPYAFMMSANFTRRNKDIWNSPKFIESRSGGIAGGFEGRDIRTDVQVGGITMKRCLIQLMDPATRQAMDGDGLLGLEMLRRFTFAFEAKNAGLWLKPNAGFDDGYDYNRSGVQVDWEAEPPKVRSVTANSPAARAGIVAGDLLPELTTKDDIWRFASEREGKPGAEMTFDVIHEGQRRTVTLVLEELL